MAVDEHQAPEPLSCELCADIRVDVDQQIRLERHGAGHVTEVVQDVHRAQWQRREHQPAARTGKPLRYPQCIEDVRAQRCVETVRLDGANRYEDNVIGPNLVLNNLPRQAVHAARNNCHHTLRCWIRFWMTEGVSGVAVILTPSGRSASATAFATAAGAPIVPPSAMPLKPPGTVRSGDSRCSTRMFGISS